MKKTGVSCLALLVLGGLLAACTPQPLRLGLVGPLSGPAAEVGGTVRNAVLLHFDDLNSRGGWQGRRLELTVIDDQNNPQVALEAFQSLRQQGINLILAPMQSGAAKPALDYANQNGMLVLSPTISAEQFSRLDDNFLRVITSNAAFGTFIAETILTSRGLTRPAILFDQGNSLFASAIIDSFEKSLGGPDKVVWKGGFSKDAKLRGADLIRQLQAGQADSLLLIASPLDAAEAVQQLRKAGSAVKVILVPWSLTPGFLTAAGQTAEGTLGTTFFVMDSKIPSLEAFRKAYEARYQTVPAWMGAYGLECAQVILQGLLAAGRDDPAAVKQAILKQKTFQGLDGPFDLDRFGDAVRPLYFYEVKGDRYVTAE